MNMNHCNNATQHQHDKHSHACCTASHKYCKNAMIVGHTIAVKMRNKECATENKSMSNMKKKRCNTNTTHNCVWRQKIKTINTPKPSIQPPQFQKPTSRRQFTQRKSKHIQKTGRAEAIKSRFTLASKNRRGMNITTSLRVQKQFTNNWIIAKVIGKEIHSRSLQLHHACTSPWTKQLKQNNLTQRRTHDVDRNNAQRINCERPSAIEMTGRGCRSPRHASADGGALSHTHHLMKKTHQLVHLQLECIKYTPPPQSQIQSLKMMSKKMQNNHASSWHPKRCIW